MAERQWRGALLLAAGLVPGIAHAGAVGDDALLRAIRADDLAAARAAIAHADPNRRADFGDTPLALAVYTQDPALVALLLASGARTEGADIDDATPLRLACELGNGAILQELLHAGADVRSAASDGTTPLAICARFGPAGAVARMLALGAPPDSIDSRGQTPLMWAASTGHVETMALLLKAGAGVNRVSHGGFTPLFFAIKSGVLPATEMLLAAGADPAHRGPEGTSAAQLAAYQKNFAAAVLLVARGADLGERDREGHQLIHNAAAAGAMPLLAALLARHADPDALTSASRIRWVTEANFGIAPRPIPPLTPLLVAAAAGQADAMKALLAAGANPRFVAVDGTNVLLAAAKGGSAAALALALTLAPNANVTNSHGETPLHVLLGAAARPHLEAMMRLLADQGARIDIATNSGMTATKMANDGLTDVKTTFHAVFPDAPGDDAGAATAPPIAAPGHIAENTARPSAVLADQQPRQEPK